MKELKGVFLFLLKILLVIGFILFFLVILAGTNEIGYDVAIQKISHTISVKELVEGGGSAWLQEYAYYSAELEVKLSPFLFPISYASGNGQVLGNFSKTYFIGRISARSETFIRFPTNTEVAQDMARDVVYAERYKNLPYFLFLGFIAGLSLTKVIHVLTKKRSMPMTSATGNKPF